MLNLNSYPSFAHSNIKLCHTKDKIIFKRRTSFRVGQPLTKMVRKACIIIGEYHVMNQSFLNHLHNNKVITIATAIVTVISVTSTSSGL